MISLVIVTQILNLICHQVTVGPLSIGTILKYNHLRCTIVTFKDVLISEGLLKEGPIVIYNVSLGLDGAAFQSRLPANKLTKQEMDFFPDIASGSQSAIMEFLFIRNKLLQAWLMEPKHELTPDKAQTIVHLPHPG